jgi:hypothetical protein
MSVFFLFPSVLCHNLRPDQLIMGHVKASIQRCHVIQHMTQKVSTALQV